MATPKDIDNALDKLQAEMNTPEWQAGMAKVLVETEERITRYDYLYESYLRLFAVQFAKDAIKGGKDARLAFSQKINSDAWYGYAAGPFAYTIGWEQGATTAAELAEAAGQHLLNLLEDTTAPATAVEAMEAVKRELRRVIERGMDNGSSNLFARAAALDSAKAAHAMLSDGYRNDFGAIERKAHSEARKDLAGDADAKVRELYQKKSNVMRMRDRARSDKTRAQYATEVQLLVGEIEHARERANALFVSYGGRLDRFDV